MEARIKKLEAENAKLKRKILSLTKDYNALLEFAKESNKQVKEYRTLAEDVIAKLTKQLDVTETYVLGSPKNFKEEI